MSDYILLLPFLLLLVCYIIGEIRVHRCGGDVYNWTSKVSTWLKQRGL